MRSGAKLTFGERAADRLKQGFGSWPFLIVLNVAIGAWMLWNVLSSARFDPYPWLALNIILSWLAAQQGGALQIAANRGDRIAAEVALHTQHNTDTLVQLLQRNTDLTEQVHQLQQAAAAQLATLEHVGLEAVAGRRASEAAFAGVQALAAVATAKPSPPGSAGTSGKSHRQA